MTESQQDQNFSQDNNDVPSKKEKKIGRKTSLLILVIRKLRQQIY